MNVPVTPISFVRAVLFALGAYAIENPGGAEELVGETLRPWLAFLAFFVSGGLSSHKGKKGS